MLRIAAQDEGGSDTGDRRKKRSARMQKPNLAGVAVNRIC
jgi:hypothetical protein